MNTEEILKIEHSTVGSKDRLAWHHYQLGQYTVDTSKVVAQALVN